MALNSEKGTTVGAKINTIQADFSETSYKEKANYRQKIISTKVISRTIRKKVQGSIPIKKTNSNISGNLETTILLGKVRSCMKTALSSQESSMDSITEEEYSFWLLAKKLIQTLKI